MPGTVEGLFILLIFVMPGFITVRTKQMIVPTVEKADAVQITLQSVTVSLLYLPLWLFFSPQLLVFRAEIIKAAGTHAITSAGVFRIGLGIFILLCLVLPAVTGAVWAVGSWNDWYSKVASRVYPKLNIPAPASGVGEALWDRLWLNRHRTPWLTVFMKDGRIYVGRGIEFSLSPKDKELLLGPDTQLFDKRWNLVRSLAAARGEGVWVPITEVSSIELHE